MNKTNGVRSFTMTKAGAYSIARDGTILRNSAESNKRLRKQIAERNAILDRVLPIATPAMVS